MKRVVKFTSALGCLTSIAGTVLAIVLYPRAKWLFAFVLIGFVVLWLNRRFAHDPSPDALATQIEHLLGGTAGHKWAVDDFENQPIRDPLLEDFRRRSLHVGLPEEWVNLDEGRKNVLRQIVSELKQSSRKA